MQAQTTPFFGSTRRFVVERELGHGGMGVVYQAIDLERNTRVALKALTHRDAINIYRLKNEFRQLADLSHPNLVGLHELCNEGNAWFFTMELVNGRPFDQYVAEHRPSSLAPERSPAETAGPIVREVSVTLSQRAIGSEFPLPRVTSDVHRLRHALRQLVEAVAALHDAGKLHRDLKPSNVLITPEGRVVVLDFGLVSNSTFLDAEAQDAERTIGGCAFGTPAYMAPEQACSEPVTPASDWYAVGVMLYEALTGQLPFDGSVIEILKLKNDSEPIPPSEIVKGVPDDLDQLCRDLLRRDPDLRPTGPEILRYLTGHSIAPVAHGAQTSRVQRQQGELFVGRSSHLAALRDAFEATRAGRPVTVLVHGLSGMGKSALVRCFANELIRGDEAVVLRGRCYERETVPYKAFDNIIDSLSRYMMRLPSEEVAELLPRNVHALTQLFPVLRRVKAIAHARTPKHVTSDARELRNQAFAALKDLLLRITDFHPLVINIDDLQWADLDSARLLSFLMGPPDPPPLLLVGAYRRDEAANSAFLQSILGGRALAEGGTDLRQVAVDALTEAEASELSSALLRDLPTANALFSSTIAAEADGVPFFITELVQHLRTRSESGTMPPTMEPASLEQVILERVAGMPEPAQRLLRVLAVAAGPIEQGVALEAAGLSQGDRAATLALRAARLIRTRGTRQSDAAETYHDRVRETVAHALGAELVREIHARIAAAMERNDVADAERLVVHYSGAGNGMRAGETAVQAAQGAADKLAFNRAAELYRRALELLPSESAQPRQLCERLGDALANAGRGAQAAEAYLSAAQGLEGPDARRLQRMAAQQYLRSGRVEEGLALAEKCFRNVGLTFPRNATLAVLGVAWNRTLLGLTGYGFGKDGADPSAADQERLATLHAIVRELGPLDVVRGAVVQGQHLRYALKLGNPEQAIQGLAWQAWSASMLKRNPKQALAILERVTQLTKDHPSPYALATEKSARAGCALFLRRMDEVLRPATEAEALFREECRGSQWEQNLAATYRYAAIEQVGGFRTILNEAPAREREANERDDRFSAAFSTLFVPFVHLVLDRPEDALAFLDQRRAELPAGYGTFHMWSGIRTTHALLYAGHAQQALRHIRSEMTQFAESPASRGIFYAVTMKSLMARCLLATSARDRATLTEVESHAHFILGTHQPHARSLGNLLLAETAWRRGDRAAAQHRLELCVTSDQHRHAPMLALYAQRRLGDLIGGEQGRALLTTCDAKLRAEGVCDPLRWSRIWIDSGSSGG